MDHTNYYKVLQVDVEAESEVVKAAYRALSRKYHPDGTHPSVDRMKRLNDAYAVLSDPQSRARYNNEVERQTVGMGRPSASPGVTPPLRYREDNGDVPRPRRSFRRNRFGVATQVALLSFCLLGLVVSGVLKPLTRAAPSPTPTPPVYQTNVETLRLAFEEDGFTFDAETMPSGEPVQRGADEAGVVTVYIDATVGGAIRFASLLLAPDENLAETDLEVQEQALARLLDATFSGDSSRVQVLQWIGAQKTLDDSAGEITVSGWLIRMWSAPEQQIGIIIKPRSP